MILVDAANAYGDVEIPVFCYEPKLGQPVGACRMCLVEIEGIPKLQTACSTPIRDGMVVHTQTERVHDAQRAVVEFLLINHPLDCPVCDKGGECPLQDITYGWGPGTSRFVEPKRHFKKPLELSPLIAIDRERCILCYRCVRYSQEVSEDYQLVLHQRGADSFVGTFDGHPYVAPFSGNIIELCPVGALTSRAYRFRARPWDIEGAGTVCAGLRRPVQRRADRPRRSRPARARARQQRGRRRLAVRQGPLRLPGHALRRAHHHADGARGRRADARVVGQGARRAASSALKKAGSRAAALAGGTTTNEEAFLLQSLLRDDLGSNHLFAGPPQPLDVRRALADPKLQASVPDLEFAHTVLLIDCDPIDEAPIWDLRIRKGVRRHGTKVVVASARPTALDPIAVGHAALRARRRRGLPRRARRGAGRRRRPARRRRLGRGHQRHRDPRVRRRAEGRGRGDRDRLRRAGAALERRRRAAQRRRAPRAGRHLRRGRCSNCPRRPTPAACARRASPPATARASRRSANPDSTDIAEGLASGELHSVWLHHVDPLRYYPNRSAWERALGTAQTVIAVESQMNDTVREFADVVFPAEAYPEKEGTLTHPDGRLQRLRPAIGHPRGPGGQPGTGVRALWQVIADVARGVGHDPGEFRTGFQVSTKLFGRRAVLQRHHARGDRRPRRALARARGRTRTPRGS